MGTVAVLNVGAGDTKLTFDKNNPSECIRAARIIRDMIRRGYALLVEVERDGEKKFERAMDFDEKTGEYLIADFDPQVQQPSRDPVPLSEMIFKQTGEGNGKEGTPKTGIEDGPQIDPPKNRKAGKTRRVPAHGTRAVSVARSAGG